MLFNDVNESLFHTFRHVFCLPTHIDVGSFLHNEITEICTLFPDRMLDIHLAAIFGVSREGSDNFQAPLHFLPLICIVEILAFTSAAKDEDELSIWICKCTVLNETSESGYSSARPHHDQGRPALKWLRDLHSTLSKPDRDHI